MNAPRRTSAAAAARGWGAAPGAFAAMLAALALLLGLLITGPAARAATSPGVEFYENVPAGKNRVDLDLYPTPDANNTCGGATAQQRALFVEGEGTNRELVVVDAKDRKAAPLAQVPLPPVSGIWGGVEVDQCGTKAYLSFRGGNNFLSSLYEVDLTTPTPTVNTTPLWQVGAGESAGMATDGAQMALSPDGSLLAVENKLFKSDGTLLTDKTVPAGTFARTWAWAPDSKLIYGTTKSANGQEQIVYTADVTDPASPVVTKHTLRPELCLAGLYGVADISAQGDRLFVMAETCQGNLTRMLVFDTSDLDKPLEEIPFDDPDTFDIYNAENAFGVYPPSDMGLGYDDSGALDRVWVVEGNNPRVVGYDLKNNRWLGLAEFATKSGLPQMEVFRDGKSVVITSRDGSDQEQMAYVPSTALGPTLLPQSELARPGDTLPRIDIAAGGGDGPSAFVLRDGGVDFYKFATLDANFGGQVSTDFDTNVVKGKGTALKAGTSRAWVKTQEGATGHLYSWYLFDALGQVGGWTEAKNVPAGLFPDKATGPNDLAAEAGDKAGDKVFAIAKTGVAVFTNTGAVDPNDGTTIKPEITYSKTIPVTMPLTGLTLSPDGKTLYGAGPKGVVSIDLASDKVTEKGVSGAGLTPTGALAVSEDGATLYAGTKDASGKGAVTEMDAATLEPGESRRDQRMSDKFDPVAMAFGPDSASPPKQTNLWTLGGAAEQFGVLYPPSANLWSVGDLAPKPAGCHGVLPLPAKPTEALAACDGGLYIIRGRGPSYPPVTQPTSPDPGTPGQGRPPATAAPAVPVPSATPTPTPGPSDTPGAVAKTTKVSVKAKKKDKLKVKVSESPKLGAQNQWKFSVAKKKGKKFAAIKRGGKVKVWRTNGRKHIKVVNLPKGKYRVVLKPQRGYEGSKSKAVKLKR